MLGDLWRRVKYSRAAVVDSRESLEAALACAPRYIVVGGSEALRAYAASLAYRGGQEAARLEVAARLAPAQAYMMLPTVGRIRDGYRQRGAAVRPAQPGRAWRLPPGVGTVLIAAGGLLAALLGEWLSFPASTEEIVRGPRRPARSGQGSAPLPTHAPAPSLHAVASQVASVCLLLLAAAALGYLVWQAVTPGRSADVKWRVDHRIQGRLVIARIRTRLG